MITQFERKPLRARHPTHENEKQNKLSHATEETFKTLSCNL